MGSGINSDGWSIESSQHHGFDFQAGLPDRQACREGFPMVGSSTVCNSAATMIVLKDRKALVIFHSCVTRISLLIS